MARAAFELERLIEPVVRGLGYELWGCDFRQHTGKAYLRVYIDQHDGITLDDCARVSHQLSGVLDVADPIKVPYTLEVSSPGLDRALLKAEHFQRCEGRKVNIRLRRLIEGHRKVVGVLGGVRDDRVIVTQGEARFELPLDAIERARLVPEL